MIKKPKLLKKLLMTQKVKAWQICFMWGILNETKRKYNKIYKC